MYIAIHNPTDLLVRTGHMGQYFEIQAGETKSFPEDLANQFLTTYGFLERREMPEEKVITQKVETKLEETNEQVVEEKSKKTPKKK